MDKDIYILGIESSCDDTSAAVLKNGVILSNVTASQDVHRAYGGVVPISKILFLWSIKPSGGQASPKKSSALWLTRVAQASWDRCWWE